MSILATKLLFFNKIHHFSTSAYHGIRKELIIWDAITYLDVLGIDELAVDTVLAMIDLEMIVDMDPAVIGAGMTVDLDRVVNAIAIMATVMIIVGLLVVEIRDSLINR